MLITAFLGRIKLFFIMLIGVLRRALCCFSRRRKPSDVDLQFVNVINTEFTTTKSPNPNSHSDRDWNTWDDTPRTVEEHIEHYRQQLGRPPTPKLQEPEPDLFGDMTPEIKPQPVYYLGPKVTEQKTDFSRLEAKTDIPIAIAPDLVDWTDEAVDAGWDNLDTETTKKLIREKRKELRSQRYAATKQKDGINPRSHQTNIAERINVQN